MIYCTATEKHRIKIVLFVFVVTKCLAQKNPNFVGDRVVIVQLFEWKWTDIADECERFLQNKKYGGVLVSPPNENIVAANRPWWERYQPVSYNLTTRSGSEEEFVGMVSRCNKVGIRIYVDAVINHMAASPGLGTKGNQALSDVKIYPGLPYGPQNFHPTCEVADYYDVANLRNCELNHQRDLDHSDEFVKKKVLEYLNKMIALGVAGFRIDSAKYMWPQELTGIYSALDNLRTNFNFSASARPFIFQDVYDLGEDIILAEDYVDIGVVTEYKYSNAISNVFRKYDNFSNLKEWGESWGFLSLETNPLVFVDNHFDQRKEAILNHKTLRQYKMALAFMLAHPYGTPSIISSYFFATADSGPPRNSDDSLRSPIIYEDGSCGNGYVCEHRWPQVYNLVEFRTVVEGTNVQNWWTDGAKQIAFSRGSKGFLALSNRGDLSQELQTSLPAGVYCDIITGGLVGGKCAGKTITVRQDGYAPITIVESDFDGVTAIHVNSKLS